MRWNIMVGLGLWLAALGAQARAQFPECKTNADCPLNTVCHQTTVRRDCWPRWFVPCKRSADCGIGFTCVDEAGSGSCQIIDMPCTTSADCPAGWSCWQEVAHTTDCTASDDAGPGPYCRDASVAGPVMCHPPDPFDPVVKRTTDVDGGSGGPVTSFAGEDAGRHDTVASSVDKDGGSHPVDAGNHVVPSSSKRDSTMCSVSHPGSAASGPGFELGLLAWLLLHARRQRCERRS